MITRRSHLRYGRMVMRVKSLVHEINSPAAAAEGSGKGLTLTAGRIAKASYMQGFVRSCRGSTPTAAAHLEADH